MRFPSRKASVGSFDKRMGVVVHRDRLSIGDSHRRRQEIGGPNLTSFENFKSRNSLLAESLDDRGKFLHGIKTLVKVRQARGSLLF